MFGSANLCTRVGGVTELLIICSYSVTSFYVYEWFNKYIILIKFGQEALDKARCS